MVVAISTRNRPMASATIISTRDMPAWDGMRTRHARAPGPRSKPRPQRECAKFIVASIQTLAFLDRPGHRHGHQRSEEHTSELQSPCNLVCRLLLEKKKNSPNPTSTIQHQCPAAR